MVEPIAWFMNSNKHLRSVLKNLYRQGKDKSPKP